MSDTPTCRVASLLQFHVSPRLARSQRTYNRSIRGGASRRDASSASSATPPATPGEPCPSAECSTPSALLQAFARKDSRGSRMKATATEAQRQEDAGGMAPETTRHVDDLTAPQLQQESTTASEHLDSNSDAACTGETSKVAPALSARQDSCCRRSPVEGRKHGSSTGSGNSTGGWQLLRQRFPLRRGSGPASREAAALSPLAAAPSLPARTDRAQGRSAATPCHTTQQLNTQSAGRAQPQQQDGQSLHACPPLHSTAAAGAAGAAAVPPAPLASRASADIFAGPAAGPGRSQSAVFPRSQPASRGRSVRGTDCSEAGRALPALPPAVAHLPRLSTASSRHSLREEAPALGAPSQARSFAAPSRAGSVTAYPAGSQPSHLRPACAEHLASGHAQQLAAARAKLAAAHHLAAMQAEQLGREARELGRLHLKLSSMQGECWPRGNLVAGDAGATLCGRGIGTLLRHTCHHCCLAAAPAPACRRASRDAGAPAAGRCAAGLCACRAGGAARSAGRQAGGAGAPAGRRRRRRRGCAAPRAAAPAGGAAAQGSSRGGPGGGRGGGGGVARGAQPHAVRAPPPQERGAGRHVVGGQGPLLAQHRDVPCAAGVQAEAPCWEAPLPPGVMPALPAPFTGLLTGFRPCSNRS